MSLIHVFVNNVKLASIKRERIIMRKMRFFIPLFYITQLTHFLALTYLIDKSA